MVSRGLGFGIGSTGRLRLRSDLARMEQDVIEGSAARPIEASTTRLGDDEPGAAEGNVAARLWRALGDDFVLMNEVRPSPRFAHARERMLMCRLYLSLIRSISDDYGVPFAAHGDSPSFRAIGIYVLFRTMMCSPVHASAAAHALKLPRATVLHGLQALIKHGWVERVGNAYRATEKVNIPDLADRMQARIEMIAETARRLAEIRTSLRGDTQSAPEPGEP